jgi:hypothetical protein
MTTYDRKKVVVTSEEDVHDSHMMLATYEMQRFAPKSSMFREHEITFCDGCDLEIMELVDEEASEFEMLYPWWADHGLLAECKHPCVLPASEQPSLTSGERNE